MPDPNDPILVGLSLENWRRIIRSDRKETVVHQCGQIRHVKRGYAEKKHGRESPSFALDPEGSSRPYEFWSEHRNCPRVSTEGERERERERERKRVASLLHQVSKRLIILRIVLRPLR